jgi:hypothetical protein
MKDVRSKKAAHRPLEGAEQGRELSRPTGLLRPSDAAILAPVIHPAVARIIIADHSLRRGTACCARCNAAERRYPLADTRSTPATAGPRPYTARLMQQFVSKTSHCPYISTRFCTKSRSHTKHTTKPCLPGSRFVHHPLRSSLASALSNRELYLLELTLTHRKKTIAPRSNRELSTNRSRANSHPMIPIPTFLTETASQTESPVTHSKQTTAPFLTGARIGCQCRANSDAFLNPRIDSSSRLAQHGAHSK